MKKLYSIGLTVTGIMSIVFAIICLAALPGGIGSWVSYKTYGGDAYTGIQNATAQAAKGYTCRTLAYIFLTMVTCGIYALVASISNLSFDPSKESNIGYIKD